MKLHALGSGALQRLHLPGSSGLWTLAGPVLVGGLVLATPPTAAAERAIDKEVVVPAPVGEVWAAWTTREGIRSFFAPDAEVDAKVGGAFHIHMDPLAPPGAKGADDMRFMALQPMRMLSFDWNAPPSLAQVRQQRTFVVVRLEPIDERQTRVRLHHTGWGDEGQWDQAYAYFDRVGKRPGQPEETLRVRAS